MADSTSGGTPVTLFVPPGSTTPTVTPPAVRPRPEIPFTGFELTTALVLMALLLAIGTVLVTVGRRPAPSRRT